LCSSEVRCGHDDADFGGVPADGKTIHRVAAHFGVFRSPYPKGPRHTDRMNQFLFSFLTGALLAGISVSAEPTNNIIAAPTGLTAMATGVAKPAPVPDAPTNTITLKVVKADSEETAGENGKAANAVDGDTNTIWHTKWQDDSPACPHEIIIELGEAATLKGFTYLPRQDESDHGQIKGYEFFTSDDGKEFGEAVKKGEFDATKDKKTVSFEPRKCRFIKLKALSEINGEAWTSAAEIGVVPAE
jgi:hypothetical protein